MDLAVDYAVFGIRTIDAAFDMLVFLESFETETQAEQNIKRRLEFTPQSFLGYCSLKRYHKQKE